MQPASKFECLTYSADQIASPDYQFALKRATSACAKTIIAGEHAVVYGAHAVAAPVTSMNINLLFEHNHEPLGDNTTSICSGDGNEAELKFRNQSMNHLKPLVEEVFEAFKLGISKWRLSASTNIKLGAGLGSSAALCVAITRLGAKLAEKTLTASATAKLANSLECRFHGTPSGLDTAVVALQEPVLFTKSNGYNLQKTGRPSLDGQDFDAWPFVLIDSSTRASTASMVSIAKGYFSHQQGDRNIARFDQTALDLSKHLEKGNLLGVADAMEKCHHFLKEAGVVTDCLDEIRIAAKRIGCLAVKPTGAGGGGFCLGLLEPRKAKEQITALINIFGIDRVFPMELKV